MTLKGFAHCLRGGYQSKIVIGYEKESTTRIPERYQFTNRIVELLEKILGSFLQNKLFVILNMALRPSACGYGTLEIATGSLPYTADYSESNSR